MFQIFAKAINGTQSRHTRDICQLKINPIDIPAIKAKIASRVDASPSALTPFNVCTSLAIVA
jgi:hypothetical protein